PEPILIDIWQGQGEQRPRGTRAHRREIAQVHGKYAMTDRGRRAPPREMDPIDEGVDGGNQVAAGGAVQEGGIVSDAQPHIRAPDPDVAEIAVDQREFGKCHDAGVYSW